MRKLISIFLVVLLCMVTIVSYADNEVNTTNEITKQEELNGLQEQRSEVQNQIQENEQQIDDINDELTDNMKKIAELDKSVQNMQESLNLLNNDIEKLEGEIQTTQQQLNKVTDEYNQKKGLLDARLVEMYKSGETRYLDVLLASSNLTELISNYYLISELAEYDTSLIDEVEKEKNQIEEVQLNLTSKQNNLNSQKQEQLKKQKVLENNKIIRESYANNLSEKEKKLQEDIDKYNKQIEEIENEIRSLATTKSFGENYLGGTMVWPIKGHYTITSKYGMRVHPITGVYKLHTGMDISAKLGDKFTAAAYGVVTKASYNSAYGNMVIIDHGGGVQTLYAHGSSIEVKVGDIVNAGDLVLKVGSTGYSTGPHAHFEIRINGETVNPLDYIQIPN